MLIFVAHTLLIAFATTSKQVRVVRALIDWGMPKNPDKDSRVLSPLNPTIRVRHEAVASWNVGGIADNLTASGLESQMSQLSYLEFLPGVADIQGRQTPPTLLSFRSHLPSSSAHFNQDVYTTVDRWELRDRTQGIHPAFEQLSSRRNSTGSTPNVGAMSASHQSLTDAGRHISPQA